MRAVDGPPPAVMFLKQSSGKSCGLSVLPAITTAARGASAMRSWSRLARTVTGRISGRRDWRAELWRDSTRQWRAWPLNSLASLSADDLRGVLVRLVEELSAVRAKVAGLEERVATLQNENTGLREQVAALTVENRTLKDEIARLKELPRRPPDKPSGMERSTEAKLARRPKKKQRSQASAWRDFAADRDHRGDGAAGSSAAGSRFKGYDDIVSAGSGFAGARHAVSS